MASAIHRQQHSGDPGSYAKFIGRVGGLAVALGVGVAVGVNPGAAWADDGTSGSVSGSRTDSAGSGSNGSTAGETPRRSPRLRPDSISSLPPWTKTPLQRAIENTQAEAAAPESDIGETGAPAQTGTGPRPALKRAELKAALRERLDAIRAKALAAAQPSGATPTESVPVIGGDTDPEVPAEAPVIVPGSSVPGGSTSDVAPEARRTLAERVQAAAAAARERFTSQLAPEAHQAVENELDSGAVAPALATLTTSPALPPALNNAISHINSQAKAFQEAAAKAFEDLKVCVCKLVLKAVDVISGVTGNSGEGAGNGGLPPVDQNPLLAAVAGWVRRELDRIMAIPQVARFVQEVTDRVTIALQEVILCANPSEHSPLPEDLERIVIAAGLDQPTDFRFLPDGRIIITEKAGAVKIVDPNNPGSAILVGMVPTSPSRELNAIELDPDYANNGYVYVAYTTPALEDKLTRYTIANDAFVTSGENAPFDLIVIPGSGAMHHGNAVLFGPDGKIYWAIGDNSENGSAQDMTKLYGKILRINPDGTIPDDNPFVDLEGARSEIYALGFRNPFRMVFTPTGQLLVADVGDFAWEELNLVEAGKNYGWPGAEGVSDCDSCNYVDPIWAYPHTPEPARAGSITGVMVYTGSAIGDEYTNKVFVADYTLHWIKVLTFDSTYHNLLSVETFDSEAGTAIQLLQGPGSDESLYQLNIYPGELYKITPSGGNRAPTAVITATPNYGATPLEVQFSSGGSKDPEGQPLSYSWDFGDGNTSTDANPTHTYTTKDKYTVILTVTDGEKTGTATQIVHVGNTPPDVDITTSVGDGKYNAGQTVTFGATATDAEDDTLPDSAYKWTVIFHHADHVHPYQDNIVGPNGSVYLSTSNHNVDTTYYEIKLTVTDSEGLSTTKSTFIYPNLVELTFGSNNPDAVYTIDGVPHKGTYTETAVVGVVREIDIPSPQTINGQVVYGNWSNGGGTKQTISTPGEDTGYNAVFTTTPSVL
ncbi:PQQ-dependent sugar dehydrogenase [Mycolicibacterium confluentis]|uniref:Uncharacterized protein n=1 Tax=Mycolicibacterium confluentis TaxID=28047 RepID=A0A7I7XQM4_9MYCO|nr:PQQ-dependent sugar dehydrogenase [Mycolicibacterium confluentis]MCV7322488.1 PQQ-dependent sugar dehydrogenase [Mycolicibacterium confluentis]ORV22491.1 hypothetical protein AWB99_26305 [Mycolicibacterium confluentis]BBZ31538.1 hypothetical protein MCNF_01430 [Mycolicibacterium confluentis]